jgi:hypothetical protein
LEIKIYKTIILPVVLYGCETWSLTLRLECRLKYLKTGFSDEYLGPKGLKIGSEEASTMSNFKLCTIHLTQSG